VALQEAASKEFGTDFYWYIFIIQVKEQKINNIYLFSYVVEVLYYREWNNNSLICYMVYLLE
jgi:hypothetical protein